MTFTNDVLSVFTVRLTIFEQQRLKYQHYSLNIRRVNQYAFTDFSYLEFF